MQQHDLNAIETAPPSSRKLAAAAMLLALSLAGGSVWAQGGPGHGGGPGGPPAQGDPLCILLGMLNPGGPMPPQCGGTPPGHGGGDGLTPEIRAQLDQVTLSVLPFFSYDVAVSAGWDTILGECVEHPELGGMGFHLHNMEQLDNGFLNLLRPEVLLYAPLDDGSMEFVGIEYIIPGPLWDSEDPPEILGQQLHFNPNVGPGIWALHVWVAKSNPEGIFADFNPDVSCEFAGDPE